MSEENLYIPSYLNGYPLTKIQDKMKQLQFKYKNDPEKLNQEVMKMYKEEWQETECILKRIGSPFRLKLAVGIL